MPPTDRQSAQGLLQAPKRMRPQTVSPRSRPRKRPTCPNTSCGLPRCSSQQLARQCDNPFQPPTAFSCRSLTSEAPSPRLPLPSGCHKLRSLRLCPSYLVSFSRLVSLVQISTSLLPLLGGRLSLGFLGMYAQVLP